MSKYSTTFSEDVIEKVREMTAPDSRDDEQEYSEGYNDALDDVVALLEKHHEGEFQISYLQHIGAE